MIKTEESFTKVFRNLPYSIIKMWLPIRGAPENLNLSYCDSLGGTVNVKKTQATTVPSSGIWLTLADSPFWVTILSL